MKKAMYLSPLIGIIPLFYPILNNIYRFRPITFIFIFSTYTLFCLLFFGVNTYHYIKTSLK